MPQPKKQFWMIVFALALLVVVFAPSAEAGGHKLVVTMDEPFEVNGQLYPGGKLSVRHVGSYSPVATFNEIRIDGRSLGVVVAQQTKDTRISADDALIFNRGGHGHLVLHAVALRGEPTRELQVKAAPAVAALPSTGVLQAATTRP